MARYKEGQSGNPTGRPKGAKNKIEPLTKQTITEFLSEQWPTIQRDFKKMEPAARIQHFMKLLAFVMPQPKQTDLNVDFTRLSDDQIDQLVEKILGDENKH